MLPQNQNVVRVRKVPRLRLASWIHREGTIFPRICLELQNFGEGQRGRNDISAQNRSADIPVRVFSGLKTRPPSYFAPVVVEEQA
jgi:hypothetical protein